MPMKFKKERKKERQKERKKENWSEIASIITSSSGITRTAEQYIPSNIWWKKHNKKISTAG